MMGQTISHYEILEKLGEGGMGVVHKAFDTHLDREVALKVLPPEKVADADRKRRFVQEAKAASALNHPNIITIYDIDSADGIDFIAMELVAGKTLDRLIPRHGLRLNEALKYSVQIAGALAAAHSAGIVHRDLKPGNVMVTVQGLVKVLDFGLAKLAEPADCGGDDTTRTLKPTTEEGMIIGTISYMSPEQAEGKKVDARSDIFSFGAVLYEMVTGRRAFQGDSQLSTLTAILREDPEPAGRVVEGLPRELERIIARCLRKPPERRFQAMPDLKVALEELKEESDSGTLGAATAPQPHQRRRLAWMIPLLTVVGVCGALWFVRSAVKSLPALTAVPLTTYPGVQEEPSFSPDGNQVAFSWDGEKRDNADIYVKLIGTGGPPLRLTTHPAADYSPSWSPDGRYIAFMRDLSKTKAGVFIVPAIGGPERELVETLGAGQAERLHGLSWSPDGKWLAMKDRSPDGAQDDIYVLSLDTGDKRRLTLPPPDSGDGTPVFSPDGRSLAFSRVFASGTVSEIFLLALSDNLTPKGEPKQLTFKHLWSSHPAWAADGREIVFSSGSWEGGLGELWRMTAFGSGPPRRLVFAGEQGLSPAISHQGNRLAYMRRLSSDTHIWRLELAGSSVGGTANLISSTGNDLSPQYSPDGKRIVFVSSRSGSQEIWVCRSDGSDALQLTALGGATVTGSPRWSPDGEWIVFDSNADGQFEVYKIGATGGRPRRLTNYPADNGAVASWSRDGQWIYFVSDRTQRSEIWKMPAEGGAAVQVTKNGGYVAFESADGEFVYYAKGLFDASLWRRPVGGGEETQVLPSLTGNAFALVSKGIYFGEPNSDGSTSIRFLRFTTGNVRAVTTIKRHGYGLSISPDERYILYTQVNPGSSNLMLVENFR